MKADPDDSHSGHPASVATVEPMDKTPGTEPDTTAEPAWGTPAPESAHWSRNKTLAAAGIALVLAGGGAAVIHAASGTSGAGGPGGPGGPGFAGPPPGFGAPNGSPNGPAGSADALHGVFVVSDGHGGFTTELTQTGTVTAITDTSITARSDDGFSQTYVIDADTRDGRSAVQAGDRATIRAVQRGGTSAATVISPMR